jgi:hypothetical protein
VWAVEVLLPFVGRRGGEAARREGGGWSGGRQPATVENYSIGFKNEEGGGKSMGNHFAEGNGGGMRRLCSMR